MVEVRYWLFKTRTQLKASSAAAPSPPPSLQWKSPGWTFAIVMDQLCLIHIMMSCFYYTAPQFENQFLGVTQVWASKRPAVHRAPCHQLQHGRRIVFNIHNPLAHLTSLVCNSWNKLFIYLCLVPYLCFLFVITIWKLSWVAASSAYKSYFEPDIDIKQLFIGFCAICTMVRVFPLQTHIYQYKYKYKCNNNSIKSILLSSKVRDWYETVFDWIPCKMHSFEYRSTSAGLQWFINNKYNNINNR